MREHLARVTDAAPAHVGDVKQSVHALEVHERTEVGEVLDHAADLVADVQRLRGTSDDARRAPLDDFATTENDVLPVVVDLDDLEFVDVADVFGEILRRNDVDLRTRQEGFHPHVDHEAAFDDGLDLASHEAAVFEDLDDLVPVLLVSGFLLGEDHHALVVLEASRGGLRLRPRLRFLRLRIP